MFLLSLFDRLQNMTLRICSKYAVIKQIILIHRKIYCCVLDAFGVVSLLSKKYHATGILVFEVNF